MQGKRILCRALGGLAVLVIAQSAWAVMSLPDGWYVDGNVGSTELTNKHYPGSSSSSGIGGSADIGYKFMPFVAAELGYSRYANTSVRDSAGTIAGIDKHYSYDVAVKGMLPFGKSGAELFAKLGAGRNASSMSISNQVAANSIGLGASSHSKTGYYAAAGAQYDFVPEFAGTIQWAVAQGSSSTGTMSLLTAGFTFIFG